MIDTPHPILAVLDRHRHWLFALVGVLLLLGYNGQWRINSDSALYAELGRNLSEGLGFTYHGKAHNWVEPGLPSLVGLTFRLFGIDNFFPVTAALLLMGAGALCFTYQLFKLHTDRPTAVLMVVLVGTSATVFRYNYVLFTDMPAFLGVMGFLYGYELAVRRLRPVVAWPLLVVSILWMLAFRPIGVIFVGTVGLATVWHMLRGPDRWRHVSIGLLVLASFVAFRILDPRRAAGAGEATFNESMAKILLLERPGFVVRRAVTEFLPTILEEHLPEAFFRTRLGPIFSSVVSLAILVSSLLLFRVRPLWAIWIGVTILQMLFWVPRERYFLPLLPLMIFAVCGAMTAAGNRWGTRWSRTVPVCMVGAFIAVNLVYVTQFVIEQRRTPFLAKYEKGEKLELIRFAAHLREVVPERTLVLSDENARQLSYFSRRWVESPPTSRYVTLTEADIAAERKRLAGVTIFLISPAPTSEPFLREMGAVEVRSLPGFGKLSVREYRVPD